MLEIPFGLRQAIESGRAVLFLGAGIGRYMLRRDGAHVPDGVELAQRICKEFKIDPPTPDLSKASQVAEIRRGRSVMESFVKTQLSGYEPSIELQQLVGFPWKAIFTTNFDRGIIDAFDHSERPSRNPIVISATADLKHFSLLTEVPIYFLHGTLFGQSSDHNIIITEDDYATFRDRRTQLFNILKTEFATCNFVYIGYSNSDPNWRTMLDEITAEFAPTPLPQSFRLAPATDPLDREIFNAKGILTLDGGLQDFTSAATSQLHLPATFDALTTFAETVPADLRQAFKDAPGAVVRLLGNWEYANDADVSPTLLDGADFFDGNKPKWGTIAAGFAVERDIEESLYEKILDFATSANQKVSIVGVLGPAGYGTSTVLMRLAYKVLSDRLGAVLRLREGGTLLDGDCIFAADTFQEAPIFIVDDASDRVAQIRLCTQRLREHGKPALFVLGSRLNEWRETSGTFRISEHIIEPLSDPEIRRLIDALERASKLGVLKELSEEERFYAIKEKHQKEMLVALREATEGKSFDAILQDEYFGISDETARHAYFIVCCFYQHGAYVRDNLLAQLLGLDLSELYARTEKPTQGVIIYDEIDAIFGHYGARARHKTIANIVWKHCGGPAERDETILESLEALNLNYAADAQAFERFYRSDRLIETISTFDKKTKFFELSLKKSPDSPYIRQHYSRMLLDNGKAQLALAQIESAIEISPRILVLHHTKAHILACLMKDAPSNDIARRYLHKSEESFRKCLQIYDRDEYALQGIAQLFLDWAIRAQTEEEFSSYISQAEEVISDALRRLDKRESLYIVSANVQRVLGDRPGSIKALENAFAASKSPYSAYLLARAYRQAGDAEKAVELLEPLIGVQQEEFRLYLEYARSIVMTTQNYARAVAVLRLGDLYGFSDARFIAVLGGCYFMDRQFDQAERVFKDAATKNFNNQELFQISFKPTDSSGNRIGLDGAVVDVKTGYSFIEHADYPHFFCPGSKYNNITMNVGKKIRFLVGFSARGASAEPICEIL